MAKVLFINPMIREEDDPRHVPYGIALLAAIAMRDGHAVALVMPFDDDDLEWYARERDPSFLASLADARQQVAQGKTLSHGELKKALGID